MAQYARRPLLYASFLALVLGVGPMVTHAITALGPVIVESLRLSATQYGWLWFVTFAVASSLSIVTGRMVDRVSSRPLVTGVFLCAFVGLVIVGLAADYPALVVASALGGLAQAVANPLTNHLVLTGVPYESRGLAIGIKQSGVQATQFVVGLLLPTLALLHGRGPGVALFLLVVVAGAVLTPRLVPAREVTERGSRAQSRARLPGIVPLVTFAFCAGVVNQAVNVYIPLFAHQDLGVPAARAGLLVAVVGGLGVASRMAWGRLSDRVHDPRAPLQWSAAVTIGSAACLLLAGTVGEIGAWTGAVLFAAGAVAQNALLMVVVVRFVPAHSMGRVSGLVAAGFYGGFMVGPVLFGMVVDARGYGPGWATVVVLACLLWVYVWVWRRALPVGGARPQ